MTPRTLVAFALLSAAAHAYMTLPARPVRTIWRSATALSPCMAIDYKDPAVAAEFNAVQELSMDEIEEELAQVGIPMPPTMNEMDVRLMLVETRMRVSGRMSGSAGSVGAPPPPPTSFANDFERALAQQPAFNALFKKYQSDGNTNLMNVASEYLNNKKLALDRYGKVYKDAIAEIEEALSAPVVQEVTSGRVEFSNFPGNMGETGVKMTLEAIGPLSTFSAAQTADGTGWWGCSLNPRPLHSPSPPTLHPTTLTPPSFCTAHQVRHRRIWRRGYGQGGDREVRRDGHGYRDKALYPRPPVRNMIRAEARSRAGNRRDSFWGRFDWEVRGLHY